MTTPDVGPLAGFTVGVTAVRRADELGAMLARRGAQVLSAPALRLVPLADDRDLFAATQSLLDRPPGYVVATTGMGFRGWLEAADAWGVGDALHRRLRAATVLTRGPKATGAVRAAGLAESYSPASESSAELLGHLLDRGAAGLRIAVQLHGRSGGPFVDALRTVGADVVELPVYQWLPPTDPGPLDALLSAVVTGGVDAITFTSAAAASAMLARCRSRRMLGQVVARCRTETVLGCVGPVTAAAFTALGVPTVQPTRYRLGALVRLLTTTLTERAVHVVVAGRSLEVRGHAVLVDGVPRGVSPAGMSLLRAMARRPGIVVPRAALLAALPGPGDNHALDVAVGRLRAALGVPALIETVVKRGYRLAPA
jgi:uroporphyrinogen-III synthase